MNGRDLLAIVACLFGFLLLMGFMTWSDGFSQRSAIAACESIQNEQVRAECLEDV